MKSKAFIIEFQVAIDFVRSYHTLLKNNRFVLKTRVPLSLGERVKVRFNTPDGNGVTVRCKISTQIDDEAWGVILPRNEDVRWLQEKAVDTEKHLGPAAAEFIQKAEPAKRKQTGKKKKKTKKKTRPEGPVTVDIAPKADAETQMLHYGAPAAEYIDPEKAGFPSLKDTGLDLLKEQNEPGSESLVVHQTPDPESPTITKVVHRKGRDGEVASLSVNDSSGDAGIDFPHGVKRPSPEAIKRLNEMVTKKKKQLAISGNATERMVLMQGRDRSIQLWVLKNPQITEVEIRWLSSMTTLTSEAVEFLVCNRRWASIPEIAVNLLSNPITPNDAIQRLLTILPTNVLLTLHKKPGGRPMVTDMAKKLLMERGEF